LCNRLGRRVTRCGRALPSAVASGTALAAAVSNTADVDRDSASTQSRRSSPAARRRFERRSTSACNCSRPLLDLVDPLFVENSFPQQKHCSLCTGSRAASACRSDPAGKALIVQRASANKDESHCACTNAGPCPPRQARRPRTPRTPPPDRCRPLPQMKVGKTRNQREMLRPPSALPPAQKSRTRYLARKNQPQHPFDAVFSAPKTRLRWSYRRRAIHT